MTYTNNDGPFCFCGEKTFLFTVKNENKPTFNEKYWGCIRSGKYKCSFFIWDKDWIRIKKERKKLVPAVEIKDSQETIDDLSDLTQTRQQVTNDDFDNEMKKRYEKKKNEDNAQTNNYSFTAKETNERNKKNNESFWRNNN